MRCMKPCNWLRNPLLVASRLGGPHKSRFHQRPNSMSCESREFAEATSANLYVSPRPRASCDGESPVQGCRSVTSGHRYHACREVAKEQWTASNSESAEQRKPINPTNPQ